MVRYQSFRFPWIFLSVPLIFLFPACNLHDNPGQPADATGEADIKVYVGRIGALAKAADINLSSLTLELSATGEAPFRKTYPLSGSGETTVLDRFAKLAPKVWTLSAVTLDRNGVVIHQGQTTFSVKPGSAAQATLNLSAGYSMLKVYFPPPQPVFTEYQVHVDGQSAAVQPLAGADATARLRLDFDYLKASEQGISHRIDLKVIGYHAGVLQVLYAGSADVLATSGKDTAYTLELRWAVPDPSAHGEAVLKVELGSIGTVVINGILNRPGCGREYLPFRVEPSTVALWKFDRWEGSQIPDHGPNALHLGAAAALPLAASPEDFALSLDGTGDLLSIPYDSRFNISKTGSITYEARVYLDAYPPPTHWNKASTLVGKYEGLHLHVFADGRIQAGGQMGNGSSWMWYAPISKPGVVPLNRWTTLAVAADQEKSQFYAYVDGCPVQLYTYMVGESYQPLYPYSGRLFRSAPSTFGVGNDTRDYQPFKGKIEAIRVSNTLVLGRGPMAITTPESQ